MFVPDPVIIDTRRSNLLHTGGVTASSIVQQDFPNHIFPLFYKAYKPDQSFIVVPPRWLLDLSIRAEYYDLADELTHKLAEISLEKEKILSELSDKYYERQKLSKKGGEKYATR